jgi:excisionase family DNA binding protein
MISRTSFEAPNRMMTIKEVAEYLSVHEKTIYRLVKSGELPALRVGGQWRFEKKVLDAWIQGRTNNDAPQPDHEMA